MIGSIVGSYHVLQKIGEGGMGEVYRARDTRLDRDVAIKILPEPFAADPERLARFDREAKTLAALNHPNIAIIHGVEHASFASSGQSSLRALVMELVDGPTLADLIAGGPLPLNEVLPIARQIAAALESAHGQGIVHRDLKPANVKVRDDGTVKVLDFGLAKALAPAAGGTSLTKSPTQSLHVTQAGVILGTAAYMSPEQARGKAVDTRSDIWAFGLVLFEMVSGRRPFDGEQVSDTLANILKSEPAWSALRPDTPQGVRRLLRRCLQKDPQHRLQHIGDVRIELDDPDAASQEPRADAPGFRRERLFWAGALLLVALAAMAIGWRTAAVAPAEVRLEVTYPDYFGYAISSDGRYIAYSAEGENGRQIWLRSLSPPIEPRAIPGTDGGTYPFWSPNGNSIGFFTTAALKRIDLDGGNPVTLANVITPAGGTWNGETILYVPNDNGGVFSVGAAGGQAKQITPGARDSLASRRPQFLPDGRHFIFYVARGDRPAGVYVGELGSQAIRRILSADGPALYASGHLFFVRERTLLAQPFDLAAQMVNGSAVKVSDEVPVLLFEAPISASDTGLIGYRRGLEEVTGRQLIWFDRRGTQVGLIRDDEGSLVANPSLSRDGRWLAVNRTIRQNVDVWTVDLDRDPSFVKLTDASNIDSLPLWSPDGTRVLFNSLGNTSQDSAQFSIRSIDGRRSEERLQIPANDIVIACDWSPDGKYLLYKAFDQSNGNRQSTGTDLLAWPLEGGTSPIVIAQTAADEKDGQFSPDGRWIAFESDESGRPEIYVQPFQSPGAKVPVSTSTRGGRQVRWRHDGRELFYIAPNGMLMAVPVNGPLPEGLGSPTPMFKTALAPFRTISRQQYVASSDGERFLIVTRTGAPPPITLIMNWQPPQAR